MKRRLLSLALASSLALLSLGAAGSEAAPLPPARPWPGGAQVTVFDTQPTFTEDSSGLDYHDGHLYAVENDSGTFWVLDVAPDGVLTLPEENAKGRRIFFPDSTVTPDSEGIAVDGEGFVYVSSERGRTKLDTSQNVVLRVDPRLPGDELTALQEWDLTSAMPIVYRNRGIEGIEWVSFRDVEGRLWDENTDQPFRAETYPDALSAGVIFVGLEANGHVYAFVLYEDGAFRRVADLDAGLGMAMALDYDVQEQVLWVMGDDHADNQGVQLILNGTPTPTRSLISPPAGVEPSRNNEGFAIGPVPADPAVERPVYRLCDGVPSGALTIGALDRSYTASSAPVFTDVKPGSYYEEAVTWAAANGVVYGVTPTAFAPDQPVTRGQAVTFLWRAAGSPRPAQTASPFTDVKPGAYYEQAVLWAVEQGIAFGTGEAAFSPEQLCQRRQLVTFLWRAAGSPQPAQTASPFTDVKPGAYDEQAVLWAVEQGIAFGTGEATFSPTEPCPRKQAATFLFRRQAAAPTSWG